MANEATERGDEREMREAREATGANGGDASAPPDERAMALLRTYMEALGDPTRAAILSEIGHAGELTPTQIAKRLGLTANNVYHHVRILRGMGLLAEPRAVPGPTYVEKYYRISPELEAATVDPNWPQGVFPSVSAAQRQAFMCAHLLEMAALLRRAAQRYAAMDPAEFDRYVDEQSMLTSINEATRERLLYRLKAWRAELDAEYAIMPTAADTDPRTRTSLLLMAGLPDFWAQEEG